jgi:hypothetical protein
LTSGSCVICPAGSYAAVGSTECSACADGSISPAGSAECTTCSSGYEYNHIVCLPSCPTGYEPVGNACVESSTLASCGGEGSSGTSVDVAHGAKGCYENKLFTCNNGTRDTDSDCSTANRPDGTTAQCDSDTLTCVSTGNCDETRGYHRIDGSCQQCEAGTAWNATTNACEESCFSSYVAWCDTTTGNVTSCVDGFVKSSECGYGCESDNNDSTPDTCSDAVYCHFVSLADSIAIGQISVATKTKDTERRFVCGTSDNLSEWHVFDGTNVIEDTIDGNNEQHHADFSPALASGTKCAFEILVGSNWYACGVGENNWNTVQITDSTTVSGLPVLTISGD